MVRGRPTSPGSMDHGTPARMPAWVMTHRDLPRIDGADVRFASGDVADVHAAMVAAAGEKDRRTA